MPNDDADADDDSDSSSDSDDLFTRPGPVGDVHWSDDDDEGNEENKTRGRRRRRKDDDDDDAMIPVPVPTDTKKTRIENPPAPPPVDDDDDDDDDDDAWAREALLESATTPAMKTGDTDGAKALLRALDGLARPPSPTYVPAVRGTTNAMRTTAMSGGLGGTRADSSRRRRDEATALDDDDDDEDEPVGMSDSERGDDEDFRATATTTTRNHDDDSGGADEFTGEMMTVYFQLPNGKKYERVVGAKMPFRSIVAAWKRSADWADVEETLGSASVKLLFDGDVIPGTKTPMQMEMEEDDTVDVMRG